MKKFIILSTIIFIIFFIFYYKIQNKGNNIVIQNKENIIAYLESIKNYRANLLVHVYSNKNQTDYEIYQEVNGEKSKQVVKSPKEIENLEIESDANSIKIRNTNLSLEKVYNNYSNSLSNLLFLNSVVKLIDNDTQIIENESTINLKISSKKDSTYNKSIEMEIEKNTGNPKSIVIKDKDQRKQICIIYNDIEIY